MGQTTLEQQPTKEQANDEFKRVVDGIKRFLDEERNRKSGGTTAQESGVEGGISDQTLYLAFDPSLVLSRARLRAGVNVFRTISETHQPVKVVLPTAVFKVLSSIEKGEDIPQDVARLLYEWRPSLDEGYFLRLKDNRDLASEFLKTCEPVIASEVIRGMETIGERTVSRRSLSARLGGVLGDMMFELLAVAHKFKARVLTFGDRLGNILHRAKFLVITLHHEMQEELKNRSHTRTALKIVVWVFSALTANYIMNLIPGMPSGDLDTILRALAWVGAALAGDKLEDAIERGLIVIVNGTVFYPVSVESRGPSKSV